MRVSQTLDRALYFLDRFPLPNAVGLCYPLRRPLAVTFGRLV
ncbi:hypothetical protein MESS4_330203 [Mesorhizobium sp. STM 4661]|nr:hypothetical protein MESS4_330203 [Mesorhizobium sp. STM 4661]